MEMHLWQEDDRILRGQSPSEATAIRISLESVRNQALSLLDDRHCDHERHRAAPSGYPDRL